MNKKQMKMKNKNIIGIASKIIIILTSTKFRKNLLLNKKGELILQEKS